MCATVGFADVQSANIVGYVSQSASQNAYVPVAVQFESCSSDGKVYVKDLIDDSNPKAGTSGTATGNNVDKIMVWSTALKDYVTYYLDNSTGANIWVKLGGPVEETTDTVDPGDGVFYKKASSKKSNLNISGQIKNSEPKTVELAQNSYTFLSNPWPVALPIKDFATMVSGGKGNTAANASANNCDKVMVWNSSSKDYDTYYYSTEVTPNAYVKLGDEKIEETTESIPAGVSFFFKKASSKKGSITFTAPEGL